MELYILHKQNDIEINRVKVDEEPSREVIERISNEISAYNERQVKLQKLKVIENPIIKSLITN
jgi:hypothetical protein